MSIGTGDLLDKFAGVGDAKAVSTKCSKPHYAEILVTKHDGVRCAPFHVSELFGIDKVNFGFERRVESVFPCAKFREDRSVAAVDRVAAWPEDIGNLAFENKDRRLRFPDDQLSAVLD